jgi:3-oxoacyl-(acyl-carrier-protein) synthase
MGNVSRNVPRVVITGMSVNTGIGDTLTGFRDALYAGRSSIRAWRAFPTERIYSKIGGDLSDYDVEAKLATLKDALPETTFKRLRKLVARAPWTTKMSMLLGAIAWIDAGLAKSDFDHDAVAVIVSGHNLNALYQATTRERFAEEPDFIDGMTSLYSLDTDHAGSMSEVLQVHGPIYTVGGACASGNIALRAAIDEVRHHDVEQALIVGAMLEFAPVDVHAMALMGAISYQSFIDQPERASRPYDVRREGFIPSHGGAALVVEKLTSAVRRGARVHAEVLACAAGSDGCHLPQPSEDGQARTMARALREAGLSPTDVDYVSAHATSTPMGDLTELRSIKRVFGDHAKRLRINAPKSMLGHTCWAAPTVETVAAIMQMKAKKLHRSINVDDLDPEVDLDICRDGNVEANINVVMKNSFGFGGIDCVSILRRWEGP